MKTFLNGGAPKVYQDKNLRINASNLCTEIMLPSNSDWSFVCVLSSINLLHYDKWKDTDAVETMVYFLDAVITEFLNKLETYFLHYYFLFKTIYFQIRKINIYCNKP